MKLDGLHVNFARDPNFHGSMNLPKIEFIALIFTFYYRCLKYKIIFNSGIKTILFLKFNRINGLVGV